LDPLAAHVLF
jgi:hypothetical protein